MKKVSKKSIEEKMEDTIDEEEQKQNILKEIFKEYEGIIVDEEEERKRNIKLSTGIFIFDYKLEGGLTPGRIMQIHAEEGVFKTTLSLLFIKEFQHLGKICAFIDLEGGFDMKWADKLGVNLSKDKFLFFRPNTGEQAYQVIEKLCNVKDIGIVVIDSMANILPTSDKEREIGEKSVGTQAQLNATSIRRLINPILSSGMILICLNQERDKIGGFTPSYMKAPTSRPGGRAIKHGVSLDISLSNGKAIEGKKEEGDENKNIIGKIIYFKIEKSRFSKPYKSGAFEFYFDGYIDNVSSIVYCGFESGIITKSGPMFYYKDKKWKGREAIITELKQNTELLEEIKNAILEKQAI